MNIRLKKHLAAMCAPLYLLATPVVLGALVAAEVSALRAADAEVNESPTRACVDVRAHLSACGVGNHAVRAVPVNWGS